MKKNEGQLESKIEPESESIIIEVVSRDILANKIHQLYEKFDIGFTMLLGGDRISCCDEGVIAEKESKFIGAATIAPNGEEMSGQPTIVALYVVPEFRGKGYGGKILEKAVERCMERGFNKIRMDVMSSNAKKIIDKLPENLRKNIDIHNLGNIMDKF